MEKIFSFDPNSPLLFTQFYFWAFFAIVYMIFALIGNKRLMRNAFLFFVSLFYPFGNRFVILLQFYRHYTYKNIQIFNFHSHNDAKIQYKTKRRNFPLRKASPFYRSFKDYYTSIGLIISIPMRSASSFIGMSL